MLDLVKHAAVLVLLCCGKLLLLRAVPAIQLLVLVAGAAAASVEVGLLWSQVRLGDNVVVVARGVRGRRGAGQRRSALDVRWAHARRADNVACAAAARGAGVLGGAFVHDAAVGVGRRVCADVARAWWRSELVGGVGRREGHLFLAGRTAAAGGVDVRHAGGWRISGGVTVGEVV